MESYRSLVDPSWELTDPNPDIFAMFVQFNREFFWDKLGSVEVKWSKRMTVCAGLCRYTGTMGLCSVVLSEPLLKLRPRKDLVQTLLHEMIHAFLFVADFNRDHDAHGPKFISHMNRINNLTGANITVYHTFHDEVRHYKVHWWKCDGPCQSRPPFYGIVKRSMNRKPGPHDFWHAEHQASCGGNFIKIKEPVPVDPPAKSKKQGESSSSAAAGSHRINEYFKPLNGSGSSSTSSSSTPTAGTSSSTSSSSGAIPKPKRKYTRKENKSGDTIPGAKKPRANKTGTKKTTGTAKPTIRGGTLTATGSGSTTVTVPNNKPSGASSGATGQIKNPEQMNRSNSSFVPFSGQGNMLGGRQGNMLGGSSFVPFTGQGHTLGSSSGTPPNNSLITID